MVYGYAGEKKVSEGNVYFLRDGLGHLKIGVATDVKKRIDSLQTANPNALSVFCIFRVEQLKDAFSIEKCLHEQFRSQRIRNEWFREEKIIEWLRNESLDVAGFHFQNIDW